MGGAFFAPLSQPVRRRIAAAALSVCANGLLIALVLLLPPDIEPAPQPDVVEIILVEREREEAARDTENTPSDTVDVPVQQDATPPPASPVAPATTRPETVMDEPPDEDKNQEDDQPTGTPGPVALPEFQGDALPLSAGRGSTRAVLRDLFCLNSSAATREAGDCPDGPADARLFLDNASPENIARAEAAFDLSPAQIRSLFGARALPGLNDLSGQAATTNQHSVPTGSADEMRDSLPPQHPDPAFGD